MADKINGGPKKVAPDGQPLGANQLPPCNTGLGGFLQLPVTLEQTYPGIVTQVYPLKADLSTLEKFCLKYLNFQPDLAQTTPASQPDREKSLAYFEPAGPWVLMQVCYYPKMEAPGRRLFSQHELAFGIPVKWYEVKNGKRSHFRNWAIVYPFIYVDSSLSMAGGRQIYGWAKAGIELDCTTPDLDPTAPRSLVSISRKRYQPLTPPESLQGSHMSLATFRQKDPDDEGKSETLLQIFQQRPFLSGRSGVNRLYDSIPRVAGGYFASAAGFLETVGNFISGYELPAPNRSLRNVIVSLGQDALSLADTLRGLYGYATLFLPAFLGVSVGGVDEADSKTFPSDVRLVTLKQFRDAEQLNEACYQAVVVSKMTVEKVVDGGLLFDPLSADLTGGVEIKLLKSNEANLADELGLRRAGSTKIGDVPADLLTPIMPYWTKMDVKYGGFDWQCWRTRHTPWSLDPTPPNPAGITPPPDMRRAIPYVPYGSGGSLEVCGPTVYEDAILRIFPVQKPKEDLQKIVQEYLNSIESPYHFEIKQTQNSKKSFLYVILFSFERMIAKDVEGRDIKGYGDRMLTFALSTEWHRKDFKSESKAALIPLYTFVGTDWNFVTEYEVYGRLAFRSTLSSPRSSWIKAAFPQQEQEVLTVSTTVLPQDRDELAREEKLIRIFWPRDGSPRRLTDDYLESFGLESYLASDSPAASSPPIFCSIALKEVRDAKDHNRAAFQSLVGIERSFDHRMKRRTPDLETVPFGGGDQRAWESDKVRIEVEGSTNMSLLAKLGYEPRNNFSLTADKGITIAGRMRDSDVKNLCWRLGTLGWK